MGEICTSKVVELFLACIPYLTLFCILQAQGERVCKQGLQVIYCRNQVVFPLFT